MPITSIITTTTTACYLLVFDCCLTACDCFCLLVDCFTLFFDCFDYFGLLWIALDYFGLLLIAFGLLLIALWIVFDCSVAVFAYFFDCPWLVWGHFWIFWNCFLITFNCWLLLGFPLTSLLSLSASHHEQKPRYPLNMINIIIELPDVYTTMNQKKIPNLEDKCRESHPPKLARHVSL